jgi:steroid delta-isomerase-like uncharacterized protein
MSPPREGSPRSPRIEAVLAHVDVENRHDLDGVMATFGSDGFYDDAPWGEHHGGLDAVRSYYGALFEASDDVRIEVESARDAGDAVILEVRLRGTHTGAWRGLPPTGRRFDLPLCAVFTFDVGGRLAGERIYYDRATVLRQLGVFSEPDTVLGRLVTAAAHPAVLVRATAFAVRTWLGRARPQPRPPGAPSTGGPVRQHRA